MNRHEAISALKYWSWEGVVPVSVLNALEREAEAGETPLDTAVRLACGRGVKRPAAFDHQAVSMLVALAEIDNAKEMDRWRGRP
jgi:hypothetical protein